MKRFRVAVLSFCIALIVGTVAACSSGGSSSDGGSSAKSDSNDQGSQTAEAPKPPKEIGWMGILHSPEPPKADSVVLKHMEALTGSKINFTWVPAATYENKLSVSIAANDLPQIVTVTNIRNSIVTNSVNSGLFWELGPYLKNYPNLSQMNASVIENTSFNGKVYGVYRERDLSKNGIVLRKDWLDNVGLNEPKTVEELYNVAKAFTLNDPDKNGKNDTFGFTESKGLGTVSNLQAWMGGVNGWGVENDKLVPDFMYPQYLEAIQFVNRLYKEKLINQDFLMIDSNKSRENFVTGKAGISIGSVGEALNIEKDVLKFNPDAKFSLVNRIQGPKGERIIGSGGHAGLYMIPKSSVKTEAELKQVLAFLDIISGEEVQNLISYGIKDVHFRLDNGKAMVIKDIFDKEIRPELQVWGNVRAMKHKIYVNGDATPLAAAVDRIYKDNSSIFLPNPTESMESKTMAQVGGTLNQIISDARNKLVLGTIDENAFAKAIEDWKNAGGDKVIEEFTKEYNDTKKNK